MSNYGLARWVYPLALLCIVAAGDAIALAEADLSAFVGRNAVRSPVLSPDGQHVASAVLNDGRMAVSILKLPDLTPVNLTGVVGYASDVQWLDNRAVLVGTHYSDGYWNTGEFRPQYWRIEIDGKRPEEFVTEYKGAPDDIQFAMRNGFGSVRLTPRWIDGKRVRAVLTSGAKSAVSRFEPGKVPGKGLFRTLGEFDGALESQFTTRSGEVLAAFGYPPVRTIQHRDRRHLWYRASTDQPFRTAFDTQVDEGSLEFVANAPGKNEVYVLEDITHQIRGLSRLNLSDGTLTPVFRASRSDVTAFELDEAGALYVVRHDDHFPQYVYPAPKHPAARIHALARRSFPNQNVTIASFSKDKSEAILQVVSDRNPGTYYLFDAKSKKLRKLSEQTPELAQHVAGTRNPIEFKAPDGTRVTGYVTLPDGKDKKLPFVVLLASEPHAPLSVWDYDGEAQLFASLGYGVLEVNHRGRSGLGRDWQNAGRGDLAGVVQADIEAGVRFVLAQGTAAAGKVCLLGKTFGGYSALMQAARAPGLYSCAVGIKGRYSFAKELEDRKEDDLKTRLVLTTVGPDGTASDVAQASAVAHAADIRAPVLLIEERRRGAALREPVRELVDVLESANVHYEVHIEEPAKSKNSVDAVNRRSAMWKAVQFIRSHLSS